MKSREKQQESPEKIKEAAKRRKFLKKAVILLGSLPVLFVGRFFSQEKLKYKIKEVGFDIHKKIARDNLFVARMIYDPVAAFKEYKINAAPALMAVIIKAADDINARFSDKAAGIIPREKSRLKGDRYFVSQIINNSSQALKDYGIRVEGNQLELLRKVSEESIKRARVIFSELIRKDIAANDGACDACNGGCSATIIKLDHIKQDVIKKQ